MTTPTILQKIVATKYQEVAIAKAHISLDELKQKAKTTPSPRGFANALRAVRVQDGNIASANAAASAIAGVTPAVREWA